MKTKTNEHKPQVLIYW